MPDATRADTNTTPPLILTQRYMQMQEWLQKILERPITSLTKIAGDASFRCYYRLCVGEQNYVVMDAPPDKESCAAFVAIAEKFRDVGVGVPEIFYQDLAQGFILLSDLGDDLYLQKLKRQTCGDLYHRAFQTLLSIQQCRTQGDYPLPEYSPKLYQTEMQLFPAWYLAKYKKIALTQKEHDILNQLFAKLVDNAIEQPQVCVHRDYHSRNLLDCKKNKVGVLDFQDAVCGPITYDLVSLLRDCYIDWPQEKIYQWVEDYYLSLKQNNLLKQETLAEFIRWFDLMGLQRHLKCLGIFARLDIRDQKPNYLQDIPRVLSYVKSVCERYAEFSALLPFLDSK